MILALLSNTSDIFRPLPAWAISIAAHFRLLDVRVPRIVWGRWENVVWFTEFLWIEGNLDTGKLWLSFKGAGRSMVDNVVKFRRCTSIRVFGFVTLEWERSGMPAADDFRNGPRDN